VYLTDECQSTNQLEIHFVSSSYLMPRSMRISYNPFTIPSPILLECGRHFDDDDKYRAHVCPDQIKRTVDVELRHLVISTFAQLATLWP